MADEHIALLARIEAAFRDVPRPSTVTKSVARALDDEWTLSEERQQFLRAQDSENYWHDVSDEDLEQYYDVITFLDEEGTRFYFPAFMSYRLRHLAGCDCPAVEWIASKCCTFPDRLRLFNHEQMDCLVDFLTFCALCETGSTGDEIAAAVDFLNARTAPAGQRPGRDSSQSRAH